MYRFIECYEQENACKSIREFGFCKVENYLTADACKDLLLKINLAYKRLVDNGRNRYKGVPDRDQADKIVYNLHNIDKTFIDLVSDPPIVEIAMQFLNDPYYRFLDVDKPNYILNYLNARSNGRQLDLHIDSGIPFSGSHTNMMQFMFLLEDFSKDKGCTVVVPKSHQSGTYTDRSLDLQQLTKLTGNAGDMFIWDSRLWHGAIDNVSNTSRWAVIATMGRWWIKQSMDFTRNLNNDIYKQCSNMQKQLLGFCSIPPIDPFCRVNTKCGYDFLMDNVEDYFLQDSNSR